MARDIKTRISILEELNLIIECLQSEKESLQDRANCEEAESYRDVLLYQIEIKSTVQNLIEKLSGDI